MNKILNVWQCLASAELGGGELVAILLAASLNERGKTCGVFVPGEGPAQDEVKLRGLPHAKYPLRKCSSSRKFKALWGNILLFLCIRKHRCQILHFHSPFAYRSTNKALTYLNGVKTIAHVHLEYEKEGLTWALQNPPDVIVVCAKFLERYVRECLPEDKKISQKIVVLSNAVDMGKFYPGDCQTARTELGWSPNIPVVLMVADLAPHKGQKTVIKAIGELKKLNKNVHCWLVGRARSSSGAYHAELRSLVSQMGINDNVFFAGQRNDVPLLMRASDCLVLPSEREGLPLCILEAQATGLPVIASPTSGIPEIVEDEKTGFIVDSGDYKKYAEKINYIINNKISVKKITDNAFEKCNKKRSWETYLYNTHKMYLDLIDN